MPQTFWEDFRVNLLVNGGTVSHQLTSHFWRDPFAVGPSRPRASKRQPRCARNPQIFAGGLDVIAEYSCVVSGNSLSASQNEVLKLRILRLALPLRKRKNKGRR